MKDIPFWHEYEPGGSSTSGSFVGQLINKLERRSQEAADLLDFAFYDW